MKTILKLSFILMSLFSWSNASAQADVASPITGHIRAGGYYLGWNASGTSGTLDIKNDFNLSIDFWTNTHLHATLDNLGSFSIGQFDNKNFFGISTDTILWHNGDRNNIFVGAGAGNDHGSGTFNTFVGSYPGNHNTTGDRNTFAGHVAGFWNDVGNKGVIIGDSAGFFNTHGTSNVFIGSNAGVNNAPAGTSAGLEEGWGNIAL